MIISFAPSFIIVSIPKTGSSSVHAALKKYNLGLRKACNLIGTPWALARDDGRRRPRPQVEFLKGKPFHTGAAELKPKLGNKYSGALTASFVRNPWDRLVSLYASKSRRGRPQGRFADFIKYRTSPSLSDISLRRPSPSRRLSYPGARPQYKWLCDENKNILVDFVGRFENFQKDFNIMCDKIGIPRKKLPHRNKSKRQHYTEYYDDETRQIVAETYKDDIEMFGYTFGE